jgi:16S rRNA (guanine527-N7)-methyltransferase
VNRTSRGRPIATRRDRLRTTPGAALAGGPGEPETGSTGHRRAPLPTDVGGLPPLPPDAIGAFEAGLRDLGLDGDPVVDRVRDRLLDHVRLMLAWASAINLTAIREPRAAIERHLLDSLSAVPVLREHGAARFVDLGTGAGFPGLPLALAVPAEDALLIDSVAKKVRFVEVAIGAAGASGVRTAATRAETLAAATAARDGWPVVTARAVAELAELAELALPLLARGGVLVAWKRGDPGAGPFAAELERARAAVDALGGATIEVRPVPVAALADHRLVVIRKIGPTPAGYPRDPAARRRRRLG